MLMQDLDWVFLSIDTLGGLFSLFALGMGYLSRPLGKKSLLI